MFRPPRNALFAVGHPPFGIFSIIALSGSVSADCGSPELPFGGTIDGARTHHWLWLTKHFHPVMLFEGGPVDAVTEVAGAPHHSSGYRLHSMYGANCLAMSTFQR
jgi:hypothetical protein